MNRRSRPSVDSPEFAAFLKVVKRYGLESVKAGLHEYEMAQLQKSVDRLSFSDDPEYIAFGREMDALAYAETLQDSAHGADKAVQRGFTKAKRSKSESLLPYYWNQKVAKEIYDHFGGCALTGEKIDIEFDHFIPVSWGHGGTYKGNMVPMSSLLNMDKDNQNPFEWVKKPEVARKIDSERWQVLIEYLANLHGIAPDQYEQYVYWCSNNRRSANNAVKFSTFWCWRELHNKT